MTIAALASTVAIPVAQMPAVAAPSSLAMERFNAIMNAPDTGMPALTGLHSAVQNVSYASVDTTGQTLGNQILAGLRATSAEFSEKWQGISGRMESMAAKPSIATMLQVQADLLTVSVQYELVGKAISRTTQNIDSITRMS